jgi:hypothetical protein
MTRGQGNSAETRPKAVLVSGLARRLSTTSTCRNAGDSYFDLTGRHKGTKVAQSNGMSETVYAFPKEEKEPIDDAAHVRNAIARFNQVKDVTDSERDAAWKRIKTAAKKFGVEVNEEDWRELSRGGKR